MLSLELWRKMSELIVCVHNFETSLSLPFVFEGQMANAVLFSILRHYYVTIFAVHDQRLLIKSTSIYF